MKRPLLSRAGLEASVILFLAFLTGAVGVCDGGVSSSMMGLRDDPARVAGATRR